MEIALVPLLRIEALGPVDIAVPLTVDDIAGRACPAYRRLGRGFGGFLGSAAPAPVPYRLPALQQQPLGAAPTGIEPALLRDGQGHAQHHDDADEKNGGGEEFFKHQAASFSDVLQSEQPRLNRPL